MSASTSADFARLMLPVAIEVLGEPNEGLSNKTEKRFGNRGALTVDTIKGRYCDHADGDKGGGVLAFLHAKRGLQKPDALTWLRERKYLPPETFAGMTFLATYDYVDAAGALVIQVCRLDPKDFRQRRPDPGKPGDWIWKTAGIKAPLYRLPEVLEAVKAGRTVFVGEGEKGVDALRKLGVVATCSPAGAGKWRSHHSPSLAGADVIILPDNDEPGRKHAKLVLKSLSGIAASVRILALPDLPEKADPFDWIADGGTLDRLQVLTGEVKNDNINLDRAPNAKTKDDSETSRRREVDQPTEQPEQDWQKYLQRDDREQPIPNLANAALVLRQAPELTGLIAFDEMARHTMLTRKVPKSRTEALTSARQIQDGDISAVQEWMQRNGLRKIGRETAQQAIDLVASEHRYHPVRDYLTGLEWDRVPRLNTFLTFYFGAVPNAYHAKIGRCFLISMVARIMQPGCKADYCLVLEGDQGTRKSTACAILGGAWFSDSLPEINHGDAVRLSMHLRGKWLIEIAELSSISKAEAGALKMFLTQTEERYLPKYGRNEVIEARQCTFIGTTNETAYLRDKTGGRRFWPVLTGIINTDALRRDRDQIFAEAMVAFCNKEKWWPDGDFEQKYISPEQERRFEVDAWESSISLWIGTDKVTVAQVARGALDLPPGRLGTADQRRITAALERLGWERGERGSDGTRWWIRRAGL